MTAVKKKPGVNSAGRIADRSFDPGSRVYVKESSERTIQRIFAARAASRAIIVREINDWTIMPSFARRDRTAVSVGEKAVLVLKARNR